MKTLHIPFLAGLFFLTLILSCSKDDPKPAGSIIGSWKFASESLTGCTDPTDNGTDYCTSDCPILIIADGTWTFTDPVNSSNSGAGTYTLSGNSITITVSAGTGYSGTFTYTVSGTSLTFSDSNYGMGCTGNLNFTKI